MICPKCGKEMCEGLIRSRICYVPFIFNRKSNIPIDTKIKFNPLVAFGPFIPLSKFSLSSPDSIAYYCDKCQLAIIDIEENLNLEKDKKNRDTKFEDENY